MSKLTDHIDVLDLLERLEIQHVHTASGGSEANYSCPFAGHDRGDQTPSAYMNLESTAWFCWGCKERGKTAVSFVAKVLNVSYSLASKFIAEVYGVEFDEPSGGSMRAEIDARFAELVQPAEPKLPEPRWQDTFVEDFYRPVGQKAFNYVLGRGFSREALSYWGAGYDFMSDRLTFPIYDVESQIVGFKGRALRDDQNPKYLVLGDKDRPRYGFAPCDPSHVVYGLHRERACRRGVLCEGELNGWALAQLGVERPLALGMSYLSETHMRLLIQELDELVVFFDTDSGGETGLWGYEPNADKFGLVKKLQPFMTVRIVPDHQDDPAGMLENGRGEEALRLIDEAQSSLAFLSLTK